MKRSAEKIQQMLNEEIDPVYSQLSAKMGEGDSVVMPHIFEKLITLEQAKILNEYPAPLENIAEKLGLDLDIVERHTQEMFEKGLIHPGRSGWHLSRSWGSFHDSVGASNPKWDNDDFFDLAFAKHTESNEKQFRQVVSGEVPGVRKIMRVVPRYESIKDIPDILPCEDVSAILRHADPIVLVHCACKKIDRERECRDSIPTETCITIGKSGDYNLNRGAGRKLEYDEAMELINELDEHPLVHLTGNTNRMPPLLCNCHSCCCGVFVRNVETMEKFGQLALAKSRFIATVDPDVCIACGLCVGERCPVGANRMEESAEHGGERAVTDPEACIGCGLCVVSCPSEARSMKLVRPPEHIPEPGGDPYATL